MSICFFEDKKVFHINGNGFSYIFDFGFNGILRHLYYGSRLPYLDSYDWLSQTTTEAVGTAVFTEKNTGIKTLSRVRQEFPTFGGSDYREPALEIQTASGIPLRDFTYISHRIYTGKDKLSGLPALYPAADDRVETLEVTLQDSFCEAFVILKYSVFPDHNGLCRSTVIMNTSQECLSLGRVASCSLDMELPDYRWVSLHGSWINEAQLSIAPLHSGIQSIESKKGISSADHSPFFALTSPESTEYNGEAYGLSLLYSGNFKAQAELDPFGVCRVQMGINPFNFQWEIKPQEFFQSPEVLLVYSDSGLSGLSLNFHRLFKEHLLRNDWKAKERPVLINNWEATYFNFNEEKLMSLAETSARLGVELFVLDDGWFKGRNDDTSSLGDWTPDPIKLPSGLNNISSRIREKGLSFGIWVEPEMISEDSDLYRLHPDWRIQLPHKEPLQGRNQYVLDLSRTDVQDHLIRVISAVIVSCGAAYIKWDMNRPLSDLWSAHLPPERQQELSHRYVLGLYRILEALVGAFPDVLFESCASGGSRFDAGMLYYMPQGWISDNTDSHSRRSIQQGFSLLYPPCTMGAHVSDVPNHQTGRSTDLFTRFSVSAFGNLGYELDLTKLNDHQLAAIRQQIDFYKKYRAVLQYGDFYRLTTPQKNNRIAWLTVSENKETAIACYFKTLVDPNPGFKRLKLTGLNPSDNYSVELIESPFPDQVEYPGFICRMLLPIIPGSGLMSAGIPIPAESSGNCRTENSTYFPDFGAFLFVIRTV